MNRLILLITFLVATINPGNASPLSMDAQQFCRDYGRYFLAICQHKKPKQGLRVRFYASNSIISYLPSTMRIKTSRLDLTLHDVQGAQRKGYEFLRVWERPASDAFRWIDEMNNNLKIVFDFNRHQFFLSIGHPKVIYINRHSNPDLNQQPVLAQGTVDGVPVNGYVPLNPQFDGYNTQPGELNITHFENAYMFMQYEGGYGFEIPIFQFRRAGSVSVTPQIQGGMYVGRPKAAIMKEGAYWDSDKYEGGNDRIMGYSITPGVRVEWRGPKGILGVFGEYRQSYGIMNHPFLDGTAKYDLRYRSINIGISVSISVKKKPKKQCWAY